MKVRELMTSPVHTCRPNESLANAAQRLWEHDCGVLPVVDRDGKVRAAITDRDICMGALLRGRALAELQVGDSMSATVVTCRADDEIGKAAETMAGNQLRRLPVVDEAGKLVGMLSLNDLARVCDRDAQVGKHALRVLTAVCKRREAAKAKENERAVTPILIPSNGDKITVSHAVSAKQA